ncbi:hypothetical protein D6783_03835, partial [Candidatus Woesearchaeota archaeon]
MASAKHTRGTDECRRKSNRRGVIQTPPPRTGQETNNPSNTTPPSPALLVVLLTALLLAPFASSSLVLAQNPPGDEPPTQAQPRLELYVPPLIRAGEGDLLRIPVASSWPLRNVNATITPTKAAPKATTPPRYEKNTSTLYWAAPPDGHGTYTLAITATDTRGHNANAKSLLLILDRPDITPLPPPPLTLEEGESISLSADIADQDENSIHLFRWFFDRTYQGDSKNWTLPSRLATPGLHEVALLVKDSDGLTATATWPLDIGNTNEPPQLIQGLQDRVINVNNDVKLFDLREHFADPDGQPLVFSATPLPPPNTTLTVPYTVNVTLRITPEGIVRARPREEGVFFVTFTAKDPFNKTRTTPTVTILVTKNPHEVTLNLTPLCGDGICEDVERCSCEEDCGPCKEPQGACLNQWVCTEWGPCLPSNVQFRVCYDENECNNDVGKPDQSQACNYNGTCMDGVWNQGEEGVDCGGPCEPCPSCTDGVRNQGEEGVDCGGPCEPCPSCDDGQHNGNETGLDCGGPCEPCPAGEACILEQDCQSLVCTNNTCQPPTCTDNVQNGREEGVDCGGPCEPCPSCTDGVRNQGEEGVD